MALSRLSTRGLRPGEKLYEELLIGDNVEGTSHQRIMKASEAFLSDEQLAALLVDLDAALESGEMAQVRELLVNAQAGYTPVSPVEDLLWCQQQKTKPDNVSSLGKPKSGPIKAVK